MDLLRDMLDEPGVVRCKFKKGDYILRQDERVQYLYYLVSGTCYRTTFTEKGDEIIFGVKKSSKNFIHSLLGVLTLYSDEICVNNFIANSNCSCYKIPKDIFLQYVQNKPEALSQLLSMAMWELRELTRSFKARQEGKVANYLCEQLLKNAQIQQGKLLVSKEFSSNSQLSKFLGVHRVTVARIIKTLKDEDIISKERDGIVILNKDQMEIYAKAEKFIEYC